MFSQILHRLIFSHYDILHLEYFPKFCGWREITQKVVFPSNVFPYEIFYTCSLWSPVGEVFKKKNRFSLGNFQHL